MLNFAKKLYFNRCMKEVHSNLSTAYRCIEMSDNCEYEGGQKNAARLLGEDSKFLLEAFTELCYATSSIPKNDPIAQYRIVEVILKIDNPLKYYRNYYGLEFMYKFKTKSIESKWNEQAQMFAKNSKELLKDEEILEIMSLI